MAKALPFKFSFQIIADSATSIIEEAQEARAILERLRNLITQPKIPEEEDFVRIMSLQESKDLTSKAVVVLSCIEGLVPFTDLQVRSWSTNSFQLVLKIRSY
jgi:hypothetical protein